MLGNPCGGISAAVPHERPGTAAGRAAGPGEQLICGVPDAAAEERV
jgi:hypothetical protein